jgi:hypothetical protein
MKNTPKNTIHPSTRNRTRKGAMRRIPEPNTGAII